MKVLLVQPPIEDFYDTRIRTYPLPLIYLATRIKDICDVSIADLRSNRKPKVLTAHPFPELKDYYKDGVSTPLSFFSRYYRFGDTGEQIERIIKESRPDVVAVSSLFTAYSGEALEIASIAKNVSDHIVTIMGGTHPTVFPESTLNCPDVDYVIRGEGETPLFQLISHLQAHSARTPDDIPGLCFRKQDGGMHVPDANIEGNIDFVPDRSFLKPRDYRLGGKSYTFLLTSRGCPFQCAFCGKPQVPFRRRTLHSIEKEIEECMGLDIRAVDFEDDMLTYDIKFFTQILESLPGTGITFSAMNGIYAETLDEKILDRMYRAGFRRLNFSLVDVSASVLERQKRYLSERFLQLLPYLEASSFLTETHFIIGLPGQKPQDVIDTLIFLMGKRLLPGPSIFYLAPGSPYFRKLPNNDWAHRAKHMRSSYMAEVNPLFPRDTIFTLMKITRLINLVKHFLDRNDSLKRLSDLPYAFATDKDHPDRYIIATLLHKKQLMHYDILKKTFIDEHQNRALLEEFFRKAHGTSIKGFKTQNSLIVDV